MLLLVTSFAVVEALPFIGSNASSGSQNTAPANSHGSNGIISFRTGSARLVISPPVTTYLVTTTADNLDNNNPTSGSLRAAIRNANLSPGADTIDFNIPGAGPHTINVGAGLPTITDTVTIDGYTQPGASANTLADGNDAVLKIEIKDQTLSQGYAFVIGASDCVLQGLVIHGFNTAIYIDGARTVAGGSRNVVRGNFIGTSPAGTAVSADYPFSAAGNLNGGVMIDSGGFKPDGTRGTAHDNVVGGTTPAARNVISGNASFGVRISQNIGTATGNQVQGNYIGTNAAGTAALGNGSGVFLTSTNNLVGGAVAGARNVISGNNYSTLTSVGVNLCCGASDNLIQGNYIGTDVTGTVALPNAVHGVLMNNNAHNNTVGGIEAAARNVISGNAVVGVAIGNSSSGNAVKGNYIGTDATGTAALGNGYNGVHIAQATSAVIGGAEPGAGNLISSNLSGGVEIVSDNTIVQGNLIGTQADGTSPLGNPQYGVRVGGTSNLIGGRAAGTGNRIAFSQSGSVDFGSGVIVTHGINTLIVGNSIHSNEGLGIDLGRNWITLNDSCDGDSDGSSNGLQNYPVLNSASSGGGNTTIQGTLNSKASTTFTLDFYANTACDPNGYGEGQTYLGSATVTTDAACDASFTASLPIVVPAGQVVTATATDPAGNTSEFSTCVQVVLSNSPPDAVNDAATTNEDTPGTISVLTNDTDPDGDAISISSFTQGANGSVTNGGGGTLTYTPNANFNGSDSFTYQISDGNGGTDIATVTVTINAVNDPPDAVDDTASTNEDAALSINVLANDTNGDCGTVTASGVTQGVNGSVVINPDSTLAYTPNTNFHGADSFTYTIGCAGGGTDTATVRVAVNPVNDAPTGTNDSYNATEDTSLNVNAATGVLANDTDPDGGALTAVLVSGPSSGLLTLNADGSFSYTPNANFNGADSFTYKANDGTLDSNNATVTISIGAGNDPPDAMDDAATTPEDTAATINVLANDTDVDGGALSITAFTQGANGSVASGPGGALAYTPNANFNGTDSFTYTASDGNGGTDMATVTITVSSVNDAPVADNDNYSVNEDSSLTTPAPGVLGNDTDAEGDTLTAALVSGPVSGVLTLNPDGSFTYSPNANFNGADSFTYRADDGVASSNTATVSITVRAVNDAPDARDDAATTAEDTAVNIAVLANDTDADGDTLFVQSVTQGANGSLSISPDGTVRYAPAPNFNGTDSFTYTVSDGNGGTDTATDTVAVSPVNDAPVAMGDNYNTNEDTPLVVPAPGVLGNDTDADGQTLTASQLSLPAHGVVSVNANGSFTYIPAANYNGTDSFTYRANDGALSSNVVTVTITINPVNDAPVAAEDTYTATENTPLTVAAPGVLANDRDVEGGALTAVLVSGPTNGTLILNADGSFTYTPDAGYSGCDSFTCKCNDGTADSPPVTVNININPAGGLAPATLSRDTSRFSVADGFASLLRAGAGASDAAAPSDLGANPTWGMTGYLNAARVFHTATLLRDGKVLVVGGTANAVKGFFTGKTFLKPAELYDPATGTWQRTGDLLTARAHHTAMLLADGRVLVAGGVGEKGVVLASAEVYDPTTGVWTRTRGQMGTARAAHTATFLPATAPPPASPPGTPVMPTGKVLVAGGVGNNLSILDSAELYDPATDTWTRARSLTTRRWAHTATLLNGRHILVAGGYGVTGSLVQNTAEVYDAAADTWTRTSGNMSAARGHHTATRLRDGRVLLSGGLGLRGILGSAEAYDPVTATFTATQGRLNTGRWLHTATLLRDGNVLVAGGKSDNNFGLSATNTAEVYDPATDAWAKTANLVAGRHSQTAMLLHNNKVLVAGGMHASATLHKAELYDPLDSRPLFSKCSGVTVTAVHGEDFHGNSRIARIENGKVPCMNTETGETAECVFHTDGVSAGLMWVEAVDGQYAKTGQAITLQGEPGGEWIVAARVNTDGTVPCVAPSGHDTFGRLAEGRELAVSCVIEEIGEEFNVLSSILGFAPLQNYATLEVCSGNIPGTHPDYAQLTRTIASCSGTIGCYIGSGAALNDLNGMERDFLGNYYVGPNDYCHNIRLSGHEVPAAKRPATRSLPAPGSVNVNTLILWRPVNPNVRIAN